MVATRLYGMGHSTVINFFTGWMVGMVFADMAFRWWDARNNRRDRW